MIQEFLTKNLEALQKKDALLGAHLLEMIRQDPSLSCKQLLKEPVPPIQGHARLLLVFGSQNLINNIDIINKNKNIAVCFFEDNWTQWMALMASVDLKPFLENSNTTLLIGIKKDELKLRFRDFFYSEAHVMQSMDMLSVPLHLESHDYFKLCQELFTQTAHQQIQSIMVSPEDAYRGLFNILRNYKALSKVSLLDEEQGAFDGMPGVVVSTGPSLNKSLEFLKKVNGKAIVFCVDSALKILLKEGIEPHFVACMERVPETKSLFSGIVGPLNTCLVTNPLVVPETIDNYPGPIRFFMRDASSLSYLTPQAPIHGMGRSSSTMAYWGLHLLGCNPIFLVGQDLAFDRFSTRSHAEGAPSIVQDTTSRIAARLKTEPSDPLACWLPGNNGTPIQSWKYYSEFIDDFEYLISQSQKKCINVIPSDYGAHIPQTLLCDPFKVLDTFLFEELSDLAQKVSFQLNQERPPVMTSDHLRSVLRKAIDFCDRVLVPALLERIDKNTLFYQYHLPTVYKASYDQQYQEWIREIEAFDAWLSGDKEGIHFKLLAVYLWPQKLKTSHILSELFNNPKPLSEKVSQIFEVLQEYLSTSLLWVSRVSHLLKTFQSTL